MPELKVLDFSREISVSDNKYIIKTLAEIQSDNELIEKLFSVVKMNYESSHRKNPVANFGIEKWKEMVLEDDVIGNGSYIYLDSELKNIMAYSFLHESENPNSYELGWCGGSGIQNKDLVPQLTRHQIAYSINQNVEIIRGEFDTTDIYAMEVLKTYPFTPCPTWVTYQKM